MDAPPHWFAFPPPPQVRGGEHAPHMRSPPHPSATGPQLAPASAQVRGVQTYVPQALGMPPPPQIWPAGQLPHWRTPPQPSPAGPH